VPSKRILIIGAGIGGLSAGCYAQMNGYETLICEMQPRSGGLCTTWERKGYKIDGCHHRLIGTSPRSSYYHLWQEIGALQGKRVLDLDIYYRVENSRGEVFNLYTDIDKLETHMKEIAPQDSLLITDFCATVRKFTGFDLPADKAIELFGFMDNLKILGIVGPYISELKKWGRTSMGEFAAQFQSPLLREAFQMAWPPGFSSLFLIMTLAWMAMKNAGYVIGGSLEIARSVEKRYLSLGGQILHKAKVVKIVVENDQAVGVLLEDGRELRSDYVVSAADGHTTIFELLEGKYVDDKVLGYYTSMPVFKPLVYIGLGVKRAFQDFPRLISGLVFPLQQPILVAGKEQKSLNVRILNFDPTLAPAGKTVMTVILETEFDYWERLHQDKLQYEAEKARIVAEVVAALDARFPGLKGDLEMSDIATPMTFKNFTGNWQASPEGWLLTPQNLQLRIKKSLPGLANFYMVGHWVQPGGGLPSGLMTGCHLIQVLCKSDSRKYCALRP
jgi:phytoene dehydrogenase-like protein